MIDMPLTEEQKSARSVYRLESAENGIRKGEIGDSYQRGVLWSDRDHAYAIMGSGAQWTPVLCLLHLDATGYMVMCKDVLEKSWEGCVSASEGWMVS